MNPIYKIALLAAGLLIERGLHQKRDRRDPKDRMERFNAKRRPRRKPPEAGIAVPAVPPKGPLPKMGGAEAPLEFD